MAEGKKGKEAGSKKGSPERPGSAKHSDKKLDKGSPKRASSAGKSKPNSPIMDAKKGENAASGSPKRPNSPSKSQQGVTGLPVLPLGQRENNRNQFNLAKARADAAAMQTGAPGSKTSTYPSSRRQSGSSQISYSSKASNRSGRPMRGRKKKGQDEPIQVFNENGKDVTPKPLTTLKPTVLHEKLMSVSGQSQFTDVEHSAPIYSRTGFSVTSTAGSLTPETVDLGTDIELQDLSDGQESRRSRSFRGSMMLETPRAQKRKVVMVPASIVTPTAEKELEKLISVTITDSPHQIMLSLRGYNLNATFETVNQVLERNARYEELLRVKLGSDNYQANVSQTLYSLQKNKEAQASALSTQSDAVQANSWDIVDTVEGKAKPDPYQPWKVVPYGSKDNKTTNPTTMVVLLPEIFTALDGPNVTPPISPPESRRQSTAGGWNSKRASTSGGFNSRRQSGFGQKSRRTSVASRRPSTSGGTEGQVDDMMRTMSPSSVATGLSAVDSQADSQLRVAPDVDISKIPKLFKALEAVERACVLNTYHDVLLEYMDFRAREIIPEPEPPPELDKNGNPIPKVPAPPPPAGPIDPMAEFEEKEEVVPKVILPDTEPSTGSVHLLWDFECEITAGRNISCMAWNKVNKNLIAVGYGEFEFANQRDGMIAFWSPKNPCYPHSVIPTQAGVTSLDFATSSPSLLAVGFYSGNLAIYDVRNPKDVTPMVKSTVATGKHSDPVWKVQWVDHSHEHGESLVSISTDGRVSQWSIKKDLEFTNLMKLKKVPTQSKSAQPQPFISRRSAGLCFEFSPKDPGIYLVGSEEGPIYKCDRSYSEQYVMTYLGHNGPVYQVRWSPFISSLFLSCSSDWTVRLWSEDQEGALLVFQTTNMSIADVRWSYTNSCVFALASMDGHIELWDMQNSVMKPVVVYLIDDCVLSCMVFTEESPILLLGGSTGSIRILRYVRTHRTPQTLKTLHRLCGPITNTSNSTCTFGRWRGWRIASPELAIVSHEDCHVKCQNWGSYVKVTGGRSQDSPLSLGDHIGLPNCVNYCTSNGVLVLSTQPNFIVANVFWVGFDCKHCHIYNSNMGIWIRLD